MAQPENQVDASRPTRQYALFWVMLGIYVVLIAWAFMPMEWKEGTAFGRYLLLPAISVLAVLGATEIFMVLRDRKIQGARRLFLLLTGIAVVGTPVSIVLHNLVSALLGVWFNMGEEGLFFILALFVFPVMFIVGVVGTIIHMPGQGGNRQQLA